MGTALIPLVNALFAPKKPRAAQLVPPPVAPAPQAWPTYADGVTPLPVMPDGSPDWNAYYTGYPSNVSQAIAPVAPMAAPPWPEPAAAPQRSEPAAPPAPAPGQGTPPAGYEGFPPPPPLPPIPPRPSGARRAAVATQPRSSSSAAIAALCPPIPLTAPPRRAPDPHTRTRGCVVCDAPARRGRVEHLVVLGPRPRQRPVEDVAPDHAERFLQVGGRARFDARRTIGRLVHAVRDAAPREPSRASARRRAAARGARHPDLARRPADAAPAGRTGSASGRPGPAVRVRGSTGRSASDSRSPPGAGSGCRRPRPPRRPRRAATSSR